MADLVEPVPFRDFIRDLLRKGQVASPSLDKFLTDENLREFQLAFTHSSYDKLHNYELAEFVGDGVLASCLSVYLSLRFPKIKSVKWMTRLKHNLSNKKFLALQALQQGFVPHIRYGAEMQQAIAEQPDLQRNEPYLSMLEDVMEAFFGCLMKMTVRMEKLPGVGFQISYNLVEAFLDPMEITLAYDVVFDGMTRLKELYENRALKLHWPHRKEGGRGQPTPFDVRELDTTPVTFQVSVYGWPLHDRTPVPMNRVKLATAVALDLEEARQQAANEAIKKLRTAYGITEKIPDPYELNVSTKKVAKQKKL